MNAIIETVFNLSFAVGLVCGIVIQRVYAHARCRWLDKHQPRTDGKRRRVPPLNPVWVGGLVVAVIVAYVLAQGQQTHNDTVALAERTQDCQTDLVIALARRGELSDKRDELSEEQRALFGLIDDATAEWVDKLLNPPANLRGLPSSSPGREEYGIGVTQAYFERTAQYRQRVADINAQVRALSEQRKQTALPSPRCGQ